MLYFGTDGIRATNSSIFFSQESLFFLGRALALWNKNNHAHYNNILCIYDTRASSTKIKHGLAHGLAYEGQTLFDGGVLPTPAAHWIMPENKFDLALILTASHNQASDNGIKILLPTKKISRTDEEEIEKHFVNLLLREETEKNRADAQLVDFVAEAKKIYISRFQKKVPLPLLTEKKIVIDCAHGAISSVAYDLFAPTGAKIICINNQPNGTNINAQCGAVHPEILQNSVLSHNADLGFSFDGDGDRVIASDKNGKLKTGDDFLALLSNHPQFSLAKNIVGTIMTNEGLAIYAKKNNKEVSRTAVGDRAIITAMKSNQAALGGEPGGHIILIPGIPSSDGPAAALWALDACQKKNDYTFNTFTPYKQLIKSIKTLSKPDFEKEPLYQETINRLQASYPLGRTVIRYSGTEPKLRIMVESHDEKESQILLNQLMKTFEKILIQGKLCNQKTL